MRRAALLASILLAAGCAAPKSALLPELPDWDTRRAVLGELQTWEFLGRIGVRTGEDGFNGKLRYSQSRRGFEAVVSGPLGIGTVLLEGDGRRVTLTDNDGVRTELEDAELELRYRYGWTIPVTSLRYWALGIPDPARPSETRFDEYGRLVRIEQQGWSVEISRYREGGGQPMPERLTAENSDTRVRLVVDHWVFFE